MQPSYFDRDFLEGPVRGPMVVVVNRGPQQSSMKVLFVTQFDFSFSNAFPETIFFVYLDMKPLDCEPFCLDFIDMCKFMVKTANKNNNK